MSRWPRVLGVFLLLWLAAGTSASASGAPARGIAYVYDAASNTIETTIGAALEQAPARISAATPFTVSVGEVSAPRAGFVAAETAPEIAGGGGRIFVTSGRGTTYDIPEGWAGRTADNGKGLVYQRSGATGNADSIRIMEPTAKFPDGYVRVYNSYGQPVDVFGKPGPAADTHISQLYNGPWPAWPN